MAHSEDRTRELILDAVEASIHDGVTVEDFKLMAAAAWAEVLRNEADYARKQWATKGE